MSTITDDRKALMNYASNLCRNRDDAEDLVQDTLLRAHTHKHQFSSEVGAYRAWLYTIARNIYFSRCRQKSMRLRLAHKVIEDDTCEAHFDEVCELAQVRERMAFLPVAQSDALMDLLNGMKYEEIAEARRVPIGTIKSRIARAREALTV